MAKFQLIVSDPKTKTSKAASLEGTKAQALGYHPLSDGERQRRLVRGRTISDDTLQINSVIVSGAAVVPEAPKEALKA